MHSKVLEYLVPNDTSKYGIFKSTIALGTVGIASHSIVLYLIIQLGLPPAQCSLCSYHFDMLRSFEAAVGELGPASVPDFNFNSLKEHAVLCCN